MDAIAHWIRLGLLCGPLERDELPEHIRVSPVGEADKPNGRARVTVDMSGPHLENPDIWSTTVPCSPNASVDQTQYDTEMVTSHDVLEALHWEGSEGYISKAEGQMLISISQSAWKIEPCKCSGLETGKSSL